MVANRDTWLEWRIRYQKDNRVMTQILNENSDPEAKRPKILKSCYVKTLGILRSSRKLCITNSAKRETNVIAREILSSRPFLRLTTSLYSDSRTQKKRNMVSTKRSTCDASLGGTLTILGKDMIGTNRQRILDETSSPESTD